MKLRIENFGSIKKGEIDLSKKISVFVGYNNTGKTYVSQLLWGLNSYISQTDFTSILNFENIDALPTEIIVDKDLITKIIAKKTESLKKNVVPSIFNIDENHFLLKDLKLELISDVEKVFYSSELRYVIFSTFNVSKEITEKRGNAYTLYKKANSNCISIEVKSFSVGDDFSMANLIKEIPFNILTFNNGKIELKDICMTFSSLLHEILFKSNGTPFFLPANRVFYPSYYKYIYSVAKDEKDLIDKKITKGESLEQIKNLSKRPYTKPVDALIEKIYELNTTQKNNNYYDDLLSDLKKIIGGEIEIKKNEGIAPINFSFKVSEKEDLDMYMASSSVNQLTTLYMYFKYWAAESNNYLIIDEPEENLHPENQIALVNILIKFVEKRNRVLITTHSPLFTDVINNYANVIKLKDSKADLNNILKNSQSDMFVPKNISYDDFGIYFFGNNEIVNYDVDRYGIFFKDFFEATDKVKNLSDVLRGEIYNLADNGKDNTPEK